LWLEMGTQRCRLVVVVPDFVKSAFQRNTRRGSKMELVVLPEVRRIGNSQGGDLDREEVVSGCKGQDYIFPVA
jgi:hypothetical protein